MNIKKAEDCQYSFVRDKTLICELIHPERESSFKDIGFSVAHAILKPGESSLPHRLKSSVEIYYILDGKGEMHIDNEKETVKSGAAIYIPPKSIQWIKNTGNSDLKFLCMVYPPWKTEDEELVK